jgi:putative peptide zinc metalloprotease protein
MAVLPPPMAGHADTQPLPATGAPESARHRVAGVPARADGVQLLGEMEGSGYREPPALARRGDGQVVQLTPLRYLVLSAVDRHRTVEEVAARVSEAYGRHVTGDNVRTLLDQRLRPAGLLVGEDGSQPPLHKANPLLALRFKYTGTDPARTRRLTTPFARLFNPLVVAVVLAAFLAVCWWVFVQRGLASATYEAFEQPVLLLLVFVATVFSAGFHEFGHAAAARRGGATPGAMGAGVYLVWPAFYTDVTDSYRLGRGGRVRTDLGGLYFNAIVAVGIAGLWAVTRYDALLLVVATQILQMLRQLAPLVRFDGYHVLADVTGVPDLFHRVRPTLLGLLPWRWRHPQTRVLKPWARTVVSVWVLIVVPVLAFSVFILVLTLPRLLGTAWAALGKQTDLLTRGWSEADVLEVAVRLVAILAVAFPILAVALLLTRLLKQVIGGVWTRTAGHPIRRSLAGVTALALVAGVAWAWWPEPGAYRPVQPYEGGTLQQAGRAVAKTVLPHRQQPIRLVAGEYGQMVTPWANGEPRPTRERPQLALVLVPRGDAATAAGTSPGSGLIVPGNPDTRPAPSGGDIVVTPNSGTVPAPSNAGTGVAPDTGADPAPAGGDTAVHPWVFPFDKPLQPGPGDNQALAVNTTDNTVTYDVAFALVWVEGDVPALNRNEAYAFASCTGCAAVSIGFQVVLVLGDNHIAAPQNISAAVNYDCVNCLTYALATQLFVTLDGPLSPTATAELDALWRQITDFGAHISEVPLSEIQSTLTGFERQILQVIEKDQGPLTPQQTTTAAPAGSAGPSAGPTDEPQPSDSNSGEESAVPRSPSSTTSSARSVAPSRDEPATRTEPTDGSPRTSERAAVQDGDTDDSPTRSGEDATKPTTGADAVRTTGAPPP